MGGPRKERETQGEGGKGQMGEEGFNVGAIMLAIYTSISYVIQ